MKENGYIIPPVLPSEVRYAASSTKNRTTFGPDRITGKHLAVLINSPARLFTCHLSEWTVPIQIYTSKAVLLFKKGDQHDNGNYRLICLLSFVYKPSTRVILNRIDRTLDEVQSSEQERFRKAFSTMDNIHKKTRLTGVSRQHKRSLYLTFINSSKAFDSAEREEEEVMKVLDSQCVNKNFIRTFRHLHYPLFVADIVLITPTISQAEYMLTDFDKACGKMGLRLNLTKTMFMKNGLVSYAPFTLNGTNISVCSSYIYLGWEMNMLNDLTPELSRRKRAA
ncbi:unnamed protein product [Angiostrongylus costaricensis]|uniref:Reverse transcriptase domain-containing protein n=1 Tax=Angiostrongylus costaricensis TaxID=334426 RepID=A0A0R3Q0D0_ANGCS|nr:unnamed protein product [Angiostrongylus costaricensis]